MAKKRTATLAQTGAVLSRAAEAHALEEERQAIVKDIERLMNEYAKITGDDAYRARKHKVGSAPNDWNRRR